jgi:hypothetical protein
MEKEKRDLADQSDGRPEQLGEVDVSRSKLRDMDDSSSSSSSGSGK